MRCEWADKVSPNMTVYHDTEWGKPSTDDNYLFELLILEGMQAGLSWQTVLNKRESMREMFDGFDWRVMKSYTDEKLQILMGDKRLIRHRLKIESLRTNALAFEKVREEYGTFATYIWSFVNHTPIVNHWKTDKDIPRQSPLSDIISKDLKNRGFKFVGSTIIYAYLQAIGVINDHIETCAYK